MPRLEELKGHPIVILLIHPLMEQKTQVISTKLVDVETSGVWLEGKDLADCLHEYSKQAIVPKMPLFCVPFAQIAWINGSADYPSLSEKRLGL
jgi:hypothetical protein